MRRRLPARHAIALERPDHGVLVMSRYRPGPQRDLAGLGAAVHQEVLAKSGCAPDECWVGIGEERATLAGAHESHREARQAAHVARVIGVLGPVVQRSRLGVYTLLAELPPDRLRHSVPAGLWSLLDDQDHGNDTLISTLETFLDNAGDVQRTAEQLCVHRATVYYRLRRIEEITQVSLANGNERLVLHLGLKVARLVQLRLDGHLHRTTAATRAHPGGAEGRPLLPDGTSRTTRSMRASACWSAPGGRTSR